ncbi:hypothetical protein MNBD_BACTEROID01-2355 [hydrothermal vent metagenome]|uniref:Uncharacterized protein n=1 Tax=hydrothermal vent metagenome TaxID=652676 RepID=A0A3B0U3G2_9ZZZZ
MDKLSQLTEKLDAKYDVFKSKGGYLNERQKRKRIKSYLTKNQPLKISDLAKKFENININTIKKEQIIRSVGKGKGTVYITDTITKLTLTLFGSKKPAVHFTHLVFP